MAIDTLAPGYGPFQGFDITSNFHEYLHVFDALLRYEFDVFVGGHVTHPGTRADVEVAREFTRDVYETVKRVHGETDLMGVFAETATQIGGYDNKYLLFKRFLDVVTERATAEINSAGSGRLAGIDVFAEDHVRTALLYVRWDSVAGRHNAARRWKVRVDRHIDAPERAHPTNHDSRAMGDRHGRARTCGSHSGTDLDRALPRTAWR